MLYFAKAFDKKPHHKSLSKIEAHGIGGKFWNWIKEWKWLSAKKNRKCVAWFGMEACN